MPGSRDSGLASGAPAPSLEVQRLGAPVGRWRTEGRVVGDAPVPIAGSDVDEWLAGGFFLVHHVDVVVGKQRVRAIELIGEYDSFTARAHDNLGNVTVMRHLIQTRRPRPAAAPDARSPSAPGRGRAGARRATPNQHKDGQGEPLHPCSVRPHRPLPGSALTSLTSSSTAIGARPRLPLPPASQRTMKVTISGWSTRPWGGAPSAGTNMCLFSSLQRLCGSQ
jgi:hypothetical protein